MAQAWPSLAPMAAPATPYRPLARIAVWAGLDDDWERPRPPIERRDWVLVGVFIVSSLLGLELARSAGMLEGFRGRDLPVWGEWLVVASGPAILLWRRSRPLTVAVLCSLHMFAAGVLVPQLMVQTSLQITYFFAVFCGVAWARDRKIAAVVISAVVLCMFVWIAFQLALGSAMQSYVDKYSGTERIGLFGSVTAMVWTTLIINALYFGGAIAAGVVSWRGARQRAELTERSETIEAQAAQLRDQAVVAERLRIARELHDVVAHHVSGMGIQAGAARRVIAKDPALAIAPLDAIEVASREAVTQMRGLLGALRETGSIGDAEGDERVTTSEPGAAQLADLVASSHQRGVIAELEVVESAPGALDALPRPIQLSVYRTVQEALTNVARHSTATAARVAVRVRADGPTPYAEVEVTDSGRPRGASSGSGLGQLGIRERAATHRGEVEIGPRLTGGYRVRVRFPLGRK